MGIELQKPEPTEVFDRIIVDDFIFQLQKMYAHLSLSQKKFYDPTEFCLATKNPLTGHPINIAIQEDAHEFLNTLIDKVENSIKAEPSHKKDSILT